ncbi:MAG: tRNA 2-selenouridine(34) synthase MnmH [Cyanobium sp.]
MRSASVAWLASTLDLPVVLLEGGYKAYRQWVLASMAQPWPIRLLGGRTGAGKTDLLLALAARGVAVVDLEGLAHHRGSSFGGLGQPAQPSSEQFENRLAAALHHLRTAQEIWLEAESAQVGRCRIPGDLWRQMKAAPLLEVRRPLDERLRHLVAIYGDQHREVLVEATERIRKRLGPQRTTAAVNAIRQGQMEEACRQMLDYYDRCYDNDTAAHRSTAVDLGERSAEEGAELLLREGLVIPAGLRGQGERDR